MLIVRAIDLIRISQSRVKCALYRLFALGNHVLSVRSIELFALANHVLSVGSFDLFALANHVLHKETTSLFVKQRILSEYNIFNHFLQRAKGLLAQDHSVLKRPLAIDFLRKCTPLFILPSGEPILIETCVCCRKKTIICNLILFPFFRITTFHATSQEK